mmetsp:Transcript_48164/g.56317  ORF Transcript_48164/g.56317 Transcript_48164/m.56317 type:complete len:89 (+) Transcript_48164:997-1263(+)
MHHWRRFSQSFVLIVSVTMVAPVVLMMVFTLFGITGAQRILYSHDQRYSNTICVDVFDIDASWDKEALLLGFAPQSFTKVSSMLFERR